MFNKEQQKAIETVEGQVILIACPGSGKTTTLLARIHRMIEIGIDPNTILMVTFTKAAADEMKKRFAKQYGDSPVTFCTIHSFCLAVLRKFCNMSKDCIVDPVEVRQFFYEQLFRHKEIADKERYLKDLLLDISRLKNSQCDLRYFKPNCGDKELFSKLYGAYEDWKTLNEQLDFDDILLEAFHVMSTDSNCLEWLKNRYRYLQIDEYQDTNFLQRDILYLLAGDNGNIAVVGDDDQSIYGFRGATPEIMLDFPKTYPNAVQIDLSTNYRSDTDIIKYAGNLIQHNKNRFSKEFLTSHSEKGQVLNLTSPDKDAEIKKLLEMIKTDRKNGLGLSNIAILYRTNQEAIEVSDSFMKEKIPFQSTEPIQDKYDHWIFRDILSYYRLSIGTAQRYDLSRIINHPNRYLHDPKYLKTDGSKKQMMRVAYSLSMEPWKRNQTFSNIEDMFYLIEKMKEKPIVALKFLGSFGRYLSFLNDYAKYREMDPSELTSYWDSYIKDAEQFETWEEWLAYIEQHKQILKAQLKKKEGVMLSTLHRSKGLEWDKVYIINCVDGTIPFKKAETKEQIEEERRLFYVGCTRAKHDLVLLNYKNGSGISPFIAEMNRPKKDIPLDVSFRK